ncbi:GAF domain-containing SpoIIE family protein phosphatase [Aeromicrobium alkaliterrae]|uniref:SpoIIE family protein phosphatase n=1 Tax=Aeromicrobium alkaliterrae TaxID=302168 RepID=A0ABP4VSL0_9ACTN
MSILDVPDTPGPDVPPQARPISTIDPALTALLDEARERLGTQSVSLLLVNEAGTVLEPHVSLGLRQSIRAASRVAVGEGFAGQIALSRQPLSVDVSRDTVINPLLRAAGIRCVLGVPVLTAARLVGVLHVGASHVRDFGADDVTALRDIADRVATIADAATPRRAHDAALVLQRSLLPTTPRRIGDLETAARYVPAEGELGGDWYDVFNLPGGGVGLVMGDVVGHGLPAAVVMGRLRSALRAYALEHDDPARVLEQLDRKIRHFEDDAFATVVYAVVRPPYDTIAISSAGHWPPLLAAPGTESHALDVTQDPMLGVAEFERHVTHLSLPAGAILCFYTDGLVERRDASRPGIPSVDEQIDLVGGLLSPDDDPESACSRLITSTIGDDFAEDDIALLVVRRT